MTIILGVDPGKSGALALLDKHAGLICVEDMPDATGHALGALLGTWLEETPPDIAYVEQVHSMPGQGVSTTFTFGANYGVILGVLGALHIPVRHVTPAKWKRTIGVTADKNTSRQRAIELWPADAERFKRKKDDGRAEAALIARYGWDDQR